ncbi:MAG: alpha/beta hydrolase-fold protein [Saprospiraceae bacterium]
MPISGWQKFFKQFSKPSILPEAPRANAYMETLLLPSQHLGRDVLVDIYTPAYPDEHDVLPLLLFNDGQDLRQMQLLEVMKASPLPFRAVGLHANERRLREYGTAHQTDYAGRGDLAPSHTLFVTEELTAFLATRFPLPPRMTIAGFSLGGLSAFDIAWRHPARFQKVGVFSGALWWRSQPFSPQDPDGNRIVHTYVSQAAECPPLQYWFQTGTADETDDRNQNGVIDSIDDTLDLIAALHKQGVPAEHISYSEVEEGRHEPATWAVVLPEFVRWALDD